MGLFESWLKENHAAYCVYCGHDVDQDGKKGNILLRPRHIKDGEPLQKHLTQFNIKTLHPVVCQSCWYARNGGRGKYPGRKNISPSTSVEKKQDAFSTATTKTYIPELPSDRRKAG